MNDAKKLSGRARLRWIAQAAACAACVLHVDCALSQGTDAAALFGDFPGPLSFWTIALLWTFTPPKGAAKP